MSNEGQRILIVDDEDCLARLMTTLLEHLGYTVDQASDGEQALQLGARHDYSAIICDLLMPIVNGMELYARWQAESPQLAERVIFITGDSPGKRTHEFLAVAGRPCLYKPFDAQDLVVTLDEVLGAAYAS